MGLERLEVTQRLRIDQLSERVRPARDGSVRRMVRGHLKEPAGRRGGWFGGATERVGELVLRDLGGRCVVAGEELARLLLRFFDVRLVERIDAEDDAGDRRRDLPADELPTEVDRIRKLDSNQRV